MSSNYYCSISFGKDSTAMLLLLIKKKYPLDEAVFYNTGMEFQAIYHVRDLIVPYLQSLKIKYTELHPEKPFLWNMFERPVCKRGTDIIHKYGYSWCGGTCRWGTSMKLAALKKHTRNGFDYVGSAEKVKPLQGYLIAQQKFIFFDPRHCRGLKISKHNAEKIRLVNIRTWRISQKILLAKKGSSKDNGMTTSLSDILAALYSLWQADDAAIKSLSREINVILKNVVKSRKV